MGLITLDHYLILSAVLFMIGTIGVLTRRNALIIFMSIEVMLTAVNITLIAFSRYHGDPSGHVLSFFVMAVAAAEAAIGLAIIVNVFRLRKTVNVDDVDSMRY